MPGPINSARAPSSFRSKLGSAGEPAFKEVKYSKVTLPVQAPPMRMAA